MFRTAYSSSTVTALVCVNNKKDVENMDADDEEISNDAAADMDVETAITTNINPGS